MNKKTEYEFLNAQNQIFRLKFQMRNSEKSYLKNTNLMKKGKTTGTNK